MSLNDEVRELRLTQGPHPEEARERRLEGRGPWCRKGPALAAFVYMLRCADGRYYVGSTRKSLEARIAEHNSGVLKGFTSQRLPVVLVWSQAFADITAAISAERQIKGWRRAKKEALIAGDFEAIQRLASRAAR